MRSVDEIIERLGGAEAAAQLTGVGTEAVRKWRQGARHSVAPLASGDRRHRARPRRLSGEPVGGRPPGRPRHAAAGATAALVLADGTVFWGRGFGAHSLDTPPVGEVCFNTGMTGYQETLTDPSYAGQIITFTFPHIGNVGANPEDIEAATIAARGLVVKQDITEPSNWRAAQRLDSWLRAQGVTGHRRGGYPRADRAHARRRRAERRACFPADGRFDLDALRARAARLAGAGRDGPGAGGLAAGRPINGTRRFGPGPPAPGGRPRRVITSSPWITGRSATSCAAWPPPAVA